MVLFNVELFAENLAIQAKNISLDKNKQFSIFEDEVKVETQDGLYN